MMQISYKKIFWINVFIVIVVALNLRAPITSLGPMIEHIKEYYNINSALAGMLTALPLIAFGFVSFFVSYFSQVRALLFALLLILIGEIIRSYGGKIGLFSGVFFIGSGIAIANVLLPSFIKEKFSKKSSNIMGLYSLFLGISSIVGVALSLPLLNIFNIKEAMIFWIIFAFLAIIFYLPHLKNKRLIRNQNKKYINLDIFKSLDAWKITILMGLQSFLSYSLFAWLSVIISQKGYDISFGSNILLLSQIIGLPVAFLTPVILGKIQYKIRIFYILSLSIAYFLSFCMLLFFDSKVALFCVAFLIGCGSSGIFTITLLLIATKSSNTAIAAKLSAMSQGMGYLIAAQAPWVIGIFHDKFGNFNFGLLLLILVGILLNIFVFLAYNAKVIK
ncbi:MFS transporter [Campylobacter volucris]|uniref:MFS transporter n=1 Tax=Campylobacter volucris TaxID=1031542 RepID=UPI001FB62D6C|nr:MFS transporter [Campylobacter volucris]